MPDPKKLVVSYAPFWHNGSRIPDRSLQIVLAALPAALFGVYRFGIPALGVLALAVSSAVLWELAFTRVAKRPVSVGDGTAAVIGLLFGMMLPASLPWWAVLTGTFIAIVVARQIYGGVGANPFNPAAVAVAILMLAWKQRMDVDTALVNYAFDFPVAFPLAAVKAFGTGAVEELSLTDLFLGRQVGGIGTICGAALLAGGIYLVLKGVIRWEIPVSFLAGMAVTAAIFHAVDPSRFASPAFHLLTGFTLIGAFFLATEDSSSPVNFIPMLIYGAVVGSIAVLIRNIGVFAEGLVFAVLVGNLIQPLLDKIRPKALGKVE
ncbi:MAG: RnfABCDGE type electron transport complex subunit D [Desulfobacterales bacterium]|jgi:electron transport complex protein RnfD|nr:RnfABCDGE type electron transport complex subunit D [Desulfobacterales bacterium]